MATVVQGVITLFREYSARTGSKMLYFLDILKIRKGRYSQ